MEFDIVDRKKYPTYPKFGFGTYIFRMGVNPFASIVGLSLFYLTPFLIFRFFGMPSFGMNLIMFGLTLMTMALLISPILLYSQKMLIENNYLTIKIGKKIIRKFPLTEITQIQKVSRFNGAYELRFNQGKKMMFLFTDQIPKELEEHLISN